MIARAPDGYDWVVSIDVSPAPREAVPQQAYVSKLYTSADIEAMIAMLREQPVLVGNTTAASEDAAKSRARTLRRYLADYDVMVTTRTWPEFDGEQVNWHWCVMLRKENEADGG